MAICANSNFTGVNFHITLLSSLELEVRIIINFYSLFFFFFKLFPISYHYFNSSCCTFEVLNTATGMLKIHVQVA